MAPPPHHAAALGSFFVFLNFCRTCNHCSHWHVDQKDNCHAAETMTGMMMTMTGDLLEQTLVLLVVEELLLLEALLQEVNLTIKTTMMIKDWPFTSSGLSES